MLDVEIKVTDDLNDTVFSMTLYETELKFIEQQVDSLRGLFFLCDVEWSEL